MARTGKDLHRGKKGPDGAEKDRDWRMEGPEGMEGTVREQGRTWARAGTGNGHVMDRDVYVQWQGGPGQEQERTFNGAGKGLIRSRKVDERRI